MIVVQYSFARSAVTWDAERSLSKSKGQRVCTYGATLDTKIITRNACSLSSTSRWVPFSLEVTNTNKCYLAPWGTFRTSDATTILLATARALPIESKVS